MALFKKKIKAADFVEQKMAVLFSPNPQQAWDKLRSSVNDAALNNATSATFHDNMRALYLELLGISVARTQRMEAIVAFTIAMSKHLDAHPTISTIRSDYNRAFGSDTNDGVVPMVAVFDDNVASGRLSEAAARTVYDEVYALLRVMMDEFQRIKLVG